MSEAEQLAEQKKTAARTFDMGSLLIEDCTNYDGLTPKQYMERTQDNLCSLYEQMFELKKRQRLEVGGEDGEILEYTKSKWSVMLPKSTVVLPRAKAPPKKKELTKWERFR
jgi:hypothetical protein